MQVEKKGNAIDNKEEMQITGIVPGKGENKNINKNIRMDKT